MAWWTQLRGVIQEAGAYVDHRYPQLHGHPRRIAKRAVHALHHLEHLSKRVQRRKCLSRWDILMKD